MSNSDKETEERCKDIILNIMHPFIEKQDKLEKEIKDLKRKLDK